MHDMIPGVDLGDEITWEPMRLVPPDPWTGHLAFAFWLVKALRPASFVELGTHSGNSYFAFCQAMAALAPPGRAYAVDTWVGDEHAGGYGEEVYADVVAFNSQHFRQFSTLIRSTFDEARRYFADASIDLLHIDGMHSYDAVRHDYETWRPALSPRAVVLFHDTNVRERDFGVWRFWADISREHPSFEFNHSNGLGVLGVGNELPPAVHALFAMDRYAGGAFRGRIAARGEAFQRQVEVGALRERVIAAEASAARAHEAAVAGTAREEGLARANATREQAHQDAVAWQQGLLAGQRDVNAAKQSTINALRQIVAGRAEAIALRDQIIDSRDALAGQLLHDVKHERWMASEERRLRAEMQAGYEEAIRGINADRKHRQDSLVAEAAGVRATATEIINAFTSSTSWKVTKPLRLAVGLLKRGAAPPLGPELLPPPLTQPPALPEAPPADSQTAAEAGVTAPTSLKQALRTVLRARLAAFLDGPTPLRVPQSEAPDVSIILVLFNQAELTFACLESIAQTLAGAAFGVEVLIADNASTDQTPALLDKLQGAVLLRNDANLHFLKAVNLAAREARGRTLLLLNNDAQLLPGSLAAALATLEAADDIGAVGGRIILPDGTLQEAGSIIWQDGACSGYARGDDPASPDVMFQRDVDYCSGAFLLTRAETWRDLGGFDEAFAPAYYEETDYCVRLWKRGLRVVYDPDAVILHYEFGSASAAGEALRLQALNHSVFKARHAEWLQGQFMPSPANVLAARAGRSTRPRVLVLEDRVPKPELGAGYPRANLLLHELLEVGADVTLFPMYRHKEDWSGVHRVLDKRIEVLLHADQTQIKDYLSARQGQFDAFLVCRPPNMRAFLDAVGPERHLLGGGKIFYDAEALFTGRELLRREMEGAVISETERHQLLANEVVLTRLADSVMSVAAQEQATLEDYGARDVRILSHALDETPTENDPAARTEIAFVGTIQDDYAPNADAVRWFAQEILPPLREELGDAEIRLKVIGKVDGPGVRKLGDSALDLAGVVDEVGPALASARVFVVPTRFAAGIPLKALQAAALGVPMVVTGLIAGQLGWRDGDELLVADDPHSFARAVARLYQDQKLWEQIRAAALARVKQDTSHERFRQTVRELVAAIPIVHRRAEQTPPARPAPLRDDPEPNTSRPAETDWAAEIPFGFPPEAPMPRVGVICHLFHTSVARELRYYLNHIPQADLFISTDTEDKASLLRTEFAGYAAGEVTVRVVPNRGRDVAPKLVGFAEVHDRYELILHLHSKTSTHAAFLAPWRSYLFETLLGSPAIVRSIGDAFAQLPDLGMVAPQHYEGVRRWLGWNGNFLTASGIAERMGLSLSPRRALDFPSGSMFWARPAALQSLLGLGLSFEDFPQEGAQLDSTPAHAIERLYFYACEKSGYTWIKVAAPALMHDDSKVAALATPADLSRFVAERGIMLTGPGAIPVRNDPAPMQTRVALGLTQRLAARSL